MKAAVPLLPLSLEVPPAPQALSVSATAALAAAPSSASPVSTVRR